MHSSSFSLDNDIYNVYRGGILFFCGRGGGGVGKSFSHAEGRGHPQF